MWKSPLSLGSSLAIRGLGSVPSKSPCSSYAGGPRAGHSTPGGISQEQNQHPHPPGHAAFDAALGMAGSFQSFCHSGYRNITPKELSKMIPFN